MSESEKTVKDYLDQAPCFLRTNNGGATDGYFYIASDQVISVDQNGIWCSPIDKSKFMVCNSAVKITEQEFVDHLKVFINKLPKTLLNKAISTTIENDFETLLKLVDIANNSKDEVTKALIPYIEGLIESSLFMEKTKTSE